MNDILVRLATATLLLSVSAVLVQGLMLVLRPSSAGVRQWAWFCVLIQGIVLFHLPVRVPWYDLPPDDRFGGKTDCVQQLSAESPSGIEKIEAETAESASATPVVRTIWPSQPSQVTPQRDWSMVIVALWVSGIAGLIIFSGLSYALFLRQLAQGRPGPSDWAEELRELLQQRGIVRTISLLVTRSIGPALCWAPWSYRICVPGPSWTKLAPTQRCHILRHELAHFERADLWRLLLVRLLALPHWFNPFAWWAVHEITQSVEWACDQEAAGRQPEGAVSLAKALIQLGVARSLGGCPARATGRSSLFVRIRRLMFLKSLEDCTMKKVLILAVAASLVAVNLVRIELIAKEPDAGTPTLEAAPTNSGAPEVVSLSETAPKEHWSLTLKETLRYALQNSKVMRQIGAQFQGLRTLPASNPTSEPTIGKPAKAMPGVTEAVIIARVNTDISPAVFEEAVRNLVSDVGVAYWELYFAYRNLESAVQGRDRALRTWQKVKALGPAGEKASAEAQARQQYFLFCTTAEQAQSQVYQNESKLRYMMGIAVSDGRLIRPADDPTTAKVSFDWAQVQREAMARSPEIREQRWRVKQRELELKATRNYLLSHAEVRMPPASHTQKDRVANAELALARERAKLRETELEVSRQLAHAIRDMDATLALTETNFHRRLASQRNMEAVKTSFENGRIGIEVLLDAQRSLSQAESDYFRSLTNYAKSISQVHYRKGSLLEPNGISLATPAAAEPNDQTGETSAKPAVEVTPASDQSATKEGAETESKPAPAHGLTAEPNADQAKAIAEIKKLGGKFTVDEKSPGRPVISVDLHHTKLTDAGLEHLKGLRQLLILDLGGTKVTNAGLATIKGLTQLGALDLGATQVSDVGLEHLKGLTQLQFLLLGRTQVTDAGLQHLRGLTKLQQLDLRENQVTDVGVGHLKGLTKLQWLNLWGTQVSDEGLEHLKGLTELQWLNLGRTQATDAGMKGLQKALPNCVIRALWFWEST